MKVELSQSTINSINNWKEHFNEADEGCYEDAVQILTEISEELGTSEKQRREEMERYIQDLVDNN